MAEGKRVERPLSPFMIGPYYRPQITSISSILTRITGNALILAAVMIVWWLLAASSSDEYFKIADWVMTSWLGQLVLLGSLWAVAYHYLTGLRHLYFDAGKGLDLPTAEKLGWACVWGSFVLTAIAVVFIVI